MKNTKNNTKTTATETVSERKWAPEVISAALENGAKPEGMSNTYWYKLRKKNGVEIVRTRKNKGEKEPKAEKPAKAEKSVKVEKTAKEIELEARRAKYAAKKDEINARRRANRAAKKAAEKKTK